MAYKRRRKPKPSTYGGTSDVQSGGGYAPKKHKPPSTYGGISDVKSSGKHGYNHPKTPKAPTYGGISDVRSSGPHGYNNPPAWIVKRQRTLRAAGYNVTVDGYWGPRAQRAWMAYNAAPVARGVAGWTAFRLDKIIDVGLAHQFAGGAATGLTGADARKAGAKVDDMLKGWKRQADQAELRRARKAAAVARNKPVRQQTIADVVALTIDPVTGKFSPENPHDVKVIQKFLRFHGYKNVKVDGLFGSTTMNALIKQYYRSQKFEKVRQIQEANKLFYGSGLLKKGKKPPEGFPLSHVPAPGELVKIVQDGGFSAELLMRWVAQHMRTDPTRLRELSVNFIQRQAKLQGGGGIKTGHGVESAFRAGFVHYSTSELIQRYGYATTAYLHGGTQKQLRQALARAARLEQQWINRRNREDAAKEGGGFFGDLLNVVSWPGDYLRDTTVGFLHEAMGQFSGFVQGPHRTALSGFGLPVSGFATSSQASRTLGSRILDEFAARHPWWSIAFELVADPLNFVPGKVFVLPAIGVYKGSLVLEKAGFRLAATGRIGKLPVVLTVPAQTGRYTWDKIDHLAADAARGMERLGQLPAYERHGIEHILAGAYRTYKHSTQLKQYVIEATNRDNKFLSFRWYKEAKPGQEASFGKVQGRMASDVNVNVNRPGTIKRGDTKINVSSIQKQLDSDLADFGPRVQKEAKGLYTGLRDERGSLVARIGGGLSRIGYQLRARLFEEVRLRAVHYSAWEDGHAYALMRFSAHAAVSKNEKTGVRFLTGELDEADSALYNEYFEEGYAKAMKKGGSHFQGGKDRYFTARTAQLRRIGFQHADTIIATLQHQLETHWEQAGDPLFGADGEWTGLGGEFTDMFETWAKEHYSQPLVAVENPSWNLHFVEDDYMAIAQEEIDRLQGIEMGRTQMLRENGEFVDEAVATKRLDKIQSDVWRSWGKDRKTGLYYDNREFVKVPVAHARVVKDAENLVEPRGFLPGKKGPGLASEVDQTLRDMVGIIYRGGGARVKVLKRTLPPPKELSAFHASMTALNETRKAAEEIALPQLLYRNGLVLEAMRLAQRAPLRMIYKGLNGATQLWKFSTLALRPGWVARNVIDNTVKMILEGVRDPRHYLPTRDFATKELHTLLDVGIGQLRDTASFIDRIFGTDAVVHFDKAMEAFWSTMDTQIIQKMFVLQDIPVPRSIIDGEFGRGSFASHYGPKPGGKTVSKTITEPGVADEMIRLEQKSIDAQIRVHKAQGGPAVAPMGETGYDWKAFSRSRGYTEEEIRDFDRWLKLNEEHPGLQPDYVEGEFQRSSPEAIREHLGAAGDPVTRVVQVPDPGNYYSRAVRFLWHITGEMPENYSRKVLYRSTYARVLRDTGDEDKAFEAGRDAVERVLFDYSKVTALEDNFKLFFPFIQFWRKNTQFWIKNFVQHPAFLAGVMRYEGSVQQSNIDEPDWMRRYVQMEGLGDVIAKVPALGFLATAFNDFQTDPLNYLSFSPLYRAFKDDNPTLPDERAGMAFIGGLIDGFSQWGLGLNPFLRKPLELAGVLNLRTWQHIFPQTDLVRIITKRFWADKFRNSPGFDLEALFLDPIYEAIGLEGMSQLNEENYNELIQREMAGQYARGEAVSRERAQAQIDGFLQFQTLTGYFTGLYGRRNTPEDLYLYQLTEQVRRSNHAHLTDKQWEEYNLWAQRKADPLAFDKYVENIPLIRAYYSFPTWNEKQNWLKENPEISAYVNKSVRYRLPGPEFARTLALVNDTRTAIEITHFLQFEDAPFEFRKRMEAALITPSLRKFWEKNDTHRKMRDNMLRGEFFKHMLGLQRTYFSIPKTDFDARSGYLDQHPELAHFWLMGNSDSDDYKAIIDQSNAALREHYFQIVETDGWDAAADLLHRFPFMFRFTSAADRVDPVTGEWLNSGGHGGGWRFGGSHGLTEHARDYLAAKSLLDFFFALPKDQQSDWLYGKSPGAKTVRDYFAKWSNGGGGNSEHAKDFLHAKKYLDYFFNLLKTDKSGAYEWLDGKSAGAKAVRAYFKKYASKGPKSEHAKAFLAVKKYLDFFFSLDSDKQREWLQGNSKGAKMVRAYFDKWAGKGPGKQARDYRRVKKQLKYYYSLSQTEAHDWLHSNDPRAIMVLAYFNRWSKLNQLSRKWSDYLQSLDPELNSRLKFWQKYWLLPPDLRPAFVMNHAAEAGVFIFGGPEQDDLFRRESEDRRQAVVHTKLSPRNIAYIRLRPFLELLATLDGSDRRLFLRANPDLQRYLDKYGKGSVTGDKHLDKLVEGYFKLPSDSPARTVYLRKHPQVQRYFDKRDPGDAAIHRLLEVYFSIPTDQRPDYVLHHPEIPAYFEQRRREADNQKAVLSLFQSADPRLGVFRAEAKKREQEMLDRLERQQRIARERAMHALELERRTRY